VGFSKRELKGLQMALNGFVEQTDRSRFLVKSESSYFLTFREIVSGAHAQDRPNCPKCGMSDKVIKRGYAYERCGRVPRFYCKRCNYRFNYRSGLEGRRGEALTIILSLDLYYRGLSLRQVSQHLKSVYGISVSHTTEQVQSAYKRQVALRRNCSESWGQAPHYLVRA